MTVSVLGKCSPAFAFALWAPILFAGCDSNAAKTPRPLPPPERYAIPEGNSELDRIAQSFRHYQPIAEAVAECTNVRFFEGLPHQTWERELRDRELKEEETVELNGHPFYTEPIRPSEKHATRLKEIFCDRSYFIPLRGLSLCGGYHPDWCVVWSSGGDEYTVQFCYGCSEMKATDGDVEVHCEVWHGVEIKRILDRYRQKRPRS